MKYDKAYFLSLITDHNLQTVGEFKSKFPAQHLWYCRNRHSIGDLPLASARVRARTLAQCAAIATKFLHRSDFQQNEKGTYLYAMRRGWLDEICAHMTPKPFVPSGGNPGRPAHNRQDLQGQRFGSWTVTGPAIKRPQYRQLHWPVMCDCGHTTIVAGGNLRNSSSTKCQHCSNQISRPMRELADYIGSLGFDVEMGSRKYGFEIDILVPSKQFFLEYDGLIWHSSKFRATEYSEAARYAKFKATGLTGMRIFADQYEKNPELIKSMIAHRLQSGSTKFPKAPIAYEIVERPAEFRPFCEANHLDGYGRSKWAIVAKSDDEVLAFMGFRPYLAGKYKGQLELSRFCTNSKFNCYGLFGKMLKMAKKHIKANKLATHIVSASDNCISEGRVYKNNGFTQVEQRESLNWYYYLHSKSLRMHRARGRRLNPPKITDTEFAQYPTEKVQTESGFTAFKLFGKWEPLYKIWGWGQRLWVAKV